MLAAAPLPDLFHTTGQASFNLPILFLYRTLPPPPQTSNPNPQTHSPERQKKTEREREREREREKLRFTDNLAKDERKHVSTSENHHSVAA